MGISKLYACLECCVEFKITVESDKDEKIIRDQYPNSAEAIDAGIDECPFCGGRIEER
jgi:DNA-directed RNA polymerase subunit RPC12/RpoP